jgi:hypothetical protein
LGGEGEDFLAEFVELGRGLDVAVVFRRAGVVDDRILSADGGELAAGVADGLTRFGIGIGADLIEVADGETVAQAAFEGAADLVEGDPGVEAEAESARDEDAAGGFGLGEPFGEAVFEGFVGGLEGPVAPAALGGFAELGDGGTEEENQEDEGADAINADGGAPGDAEPGAEGEEEKEFEFEDVAAGFGDEVEVVEIEAACDGEEGESGEGGEADGGGGLPAAQEEGGEQDQAGGKEFLGTRHRHRVYPIPARVRKKMISPRVFSRGLVNLRRTHWTPGGVAMRWNQRASMRSMGRSPRLDSAFQYLSKVTWATRASPGAVGRARRISSSSVPCQRVEVGTSGPCSRRLT